MDNEDVVHSVLAFLQPNERCAVARTSRSFLAAATFEPWWRAQYSSQFGAPPVIHAPRSLVRIAAPRRSTRMACAFWVDHFFSMLLPRLVVLQCFTPLLVFCVILTLASLKFWSFQRTALLVSE
jgi:hypothetical protein